MLPMTYYLHHFRAKTSLRNELRNTFFGFFLNNNLECHVMIYNASICVFVYRSHYLSYRTGTSTSNIYCFHWHFFSLFICNSYSSLFREEGYCYVISRSSKESCISYFYYRGHVVIIYVCQKYMINCCLRIIILYIHSILLHINIYTNIHFCCMNDVFLFSNLVSLTCRTIILWIFVIVFCFVLIRTYVSKTH